MMTEQTKQTAVQLVQAAEQLGITPEALRMRVKRGKAEGFKRNGRWHVYVNTAPKQLIGRPPSRAMRWLRTTSVRCMASDVPRPVTCCTPIQ